MSHFFGKPKEDPILVCPRDAQPMLKILRNDVVLDECGGCKGLWFDAKELKAVAEDAELEKRATHMRQFPQASPFACPRCQGACYRSFVGDVEVDSCSKCHGVWLDAYELEESKRQLETERLLASSGPGFRGFLSRL